MFACFSVFACKIPSETLTEMTKVGAAETTTTTTTPEIAHVIIDPDNDDDIVFVKTVPVKSKTKPARAPRKKPITTTIQQQPKVVKLKAPLTPKKRKKKMVDCVILFAKEAVQNIHGRMTQQLSTSDENNAASSSTPAFSDREPLDYSNPKDLWRMTAHTHDSASSDTYLSAALSNVSVYQSVNSDRVAINYAASDMVIVLSSSDDDFDHNAAEQLLETRHAIKMHAMTQASVDTLGDLIECQLQDPAESFDATIQDSFTLTPSQRILSEHNLELSKDACTPESVGNSLGSI